jgi:DhnA family fructose-bisphosphate aldolase class Ia
LICTFWAFWLRGLVREAARLACRFIAELGAQYVKTYYVDEGFETITVPCPVPIVMAGSPASARCRRTRSGRQLEFVAAEVAKFRI